MALAAAAGDSRALDSLVEAVRVARTSYRDREWDRKRFEIVGEAIRRVASDDVLTRAEEANVSRVLDALGVSVDDLARQNPPLYEELIVARINDGRPPVLTDCAAVLKRGEVAHGQFAASLMKEVIRREYRGGSSGVSVPIGLGMRYRVGSYRGKSVVVGTDLVVADTGHLVVTNSRAVFIGSKKTLEFRYDRLVGLQQYRDGLRLNVSNRQTASLLKIPAPSMPAIAVALISNGASHQ